MHFHASSPSIARCTGVALLSLVLAACTTGKAPPLPPCDAFGVSIHDPAEPVNRSIFRFNRVVDDYALAPVARGYRHIPQVMQAGMHNFVANFGEPKVFINDLLQGNARRSVDTFGRFAINTTVGIVGLIDVSGKLGIERHKADFGQTFGVWNITHGPIVELPLLGTSNLRDAAGTLLGFAVDPFGDNSATVQTLSTVALVGGVVDGRAQLLPLTDKLITQPDYYRALRDTVAQRRAGFVLDGKQGSTSTPIRPPAPQCPLP